MADVEKKKSAALAAIDTAKTLAEKVAPFLDVGLGKDSLTVGVGLNPIKYLLLLLEHLGVTREELIDFLTKFLIYAVGPLELVVKAIILSNVRLMISCSADPRIPYRYRKHIKNEDGSPNQYGIDIPIESIDIHNKLSISPLEDAGRSWYFGNRTPDDNVYKFLRAEDFDAFLWLVIHKGKNPSAGNLGELKAPDYFEKGYNVNGIANPSFTGNEYSGKENLLAQTNITWGKDVTGEYVSGGVSTTGNYKIWGTILPGASFNQGNTLAMCVDATYGGEEGKDITENVIIPCSDDWTSYNWYNQPFLNRVISLVASPALDKKKRDYDKEVPICNLQYLSNDAESSMSPGLADHTIRFSILPKPYIFIKGFLVKKLVFNARGEYDSGKNYSIREEDFIASNKTLPDFDYTIESKGSTNKVYIHISKAGKVAVADGSGNESNGQELLIPYLRPCYKGLTIYEFNFDYVMGMRLFESRVLANQLIESLSNTWFGFNATFTRKKREGTDAIKDVVKKILETDGTEHNDCFFTFDNSKYDEMIKKAQDKRARNERFGDVTHEAGSFDSVKAIFDEYDIATNKVEQQEILKRAFTEASVTITEGVSDKDKISAQFNFITDLIEQLVSALVNAILSPKLLLLLKVNKEIMGDVGVKFDLYAFLSAFGAIIKAIVNEVRDMLIQQLLELLLSKLKPFADLMVNLLIKEAIRDYTNIIKQILENCTFSLFGKTKYLDTQLDIVDYADIDNNDNDVPKTEC